MIDSFYSVFVKLSSEYEFLSVFPIAHMKTAELETCVNKDFCEFYTN